MVPTVFPARCIACIFILGGVLAGCATQMPAPPSDAAQTRPEAAASSSRSADALYVVDCLLPGQIRKLGRAMTYLTPRRPIKTSAQDCEIRGGEYVSYDRSDYATALKVWLPLAQEGDRVAQTYVGEIYEKGLGVASDYTLAAAWYRKAAEQGETRAQINLGHLYEKGLGVEKDPVAALQWYRKASGLSEAITLDSATLNTNRQEELKALQQEVEASRRESVALRTQLQRTQQQLIDTRQALAQRQTDMATAQQALTAAQQELAVQKQQAATRHTGDVQRLETQLQQREADLARQQQELTSLRQTLARLEGEAEQQRAQLAAAQSPKVSVAGPSIEIIDPPLVGTRGLSVVRVSPDLQERKRVIVGRVTAPAGLLTFTVNDREETVNDRGLFRVAVPVQRSMVPVKVVAIDAQGTRTSVEFQLTAEATPGPPAPAPPAKPVGYGAYHALIIGNQTYSHWPRLNTPEQDARKAAYLLGTKYGFKTTVLLNATRYDIVQALNELRKTLTERDNLLIYYAGHGHLDKAIDRGYWVPVDGHLDSNVNWISTLAVTDILSAMSARHILVVADSCYAGALTRSALARLEAGRSEAARSHWLKVMAEKRSRTVLTSGDLQPVLDSGGGDHSVFAKAFLDVLATNAEMLEGQRLHREIAARVAYAASAEMADQVPQYAPIRFAGHEAGDFIFVPVTP